MLTLPLGLTLPVGLEIVEQRGYDLTPAPLEKDAAEKLLEQELVTDPKAAARLEAIRQLDDVSYDTGFEPPISDLELDGLDLER